MRNHPLLAQNDEGPELLLLAMSLEDLTKMLHPVSSPDATTSATDVSCSGVNSLLATMIVQLPQRIAGAKIRREAATRVAGQDGEVCHCLMAMSVADFSII